MNGQTVNGQILYVSRAQKKKERQQELMRRHEAEKMERYNKYGQYMTNLFALTVVSCGTGIRV